MCKSDKENFQKLSSIYPIEANMIWLYKNDCSYLDKEKTQVDYQEIEKRAREMNERRK